ncbi:MAG: glutamine synthetase family protein [Desulfobacterales bacterium]|nr:glutamine synthetase family protein [Desulfobacterales bacterium]
MDSHQDKLRDFLHAHPDIELFEMILPDICGGLRGKWLTRDKIGKLLAAELKMPLSSLACDVWGRDGAAWVFGSGDGDGYCEPDIRTLAVVPWHARPMAQLVISMREVGGAPCSYDSRYMLQNLMSRFRAVGLTPVVATEIEFCLLRDEQDSLGRPLHSQTDRVGGALAAGQTYCVDTLEDMAALMHGIRDACAAQNLQIDTLIKEAAPSQYEINLYHSPDALVAADQAMMLKRAIKAVARQQGLLATFMAKPFGDLAGNGMHVHCSLLDDDGNNAFAGGTGQGNQLLRQAVAGCLATMEESMLLFAPNLNSYRRFQLGSHAPMAPCWGYENRTVAVRIPTDAAEATRIEHRVPGADANPYLVIAGILAGILHGIEHQLQAPPPLTGNAYEQLPASLPRHWPEALARFTTSGFIRDNLGENFQQVYTVLKQQELDEFDRQVTPMEYDACL